MVGPELLAAILKPSLYNIRNQILGIRNHVPTPRRFKQILSGLRKIYPENR